MSLASSLVALTLAVHAPAPARQVPSGTTTLKPQGCTGTVSGAATGTFGCKVSIVSTGGGGAQLAFTPTKLPKSIKTISLGTVSIDPPLEQGGAYGIDRLKELQVLLSAPKHRTFVVEKGGKAKQPRGEATLTVEHLENLGSHSSLLMNGKLAYRLVPYDGKGKDEVRIEITF
jgi:hypothetical protein